MAELLSNRQFCSNDIIRMLEEQVIDLSNKVQMKTFVICMNTWMILYVVVLL